MQEDRSDEETYGIVYRHVKLRRGKKPFHVKDVPIALLGGSVSSLTCVEDPAGAVLKGLAKPLDAEEVARRCYRGLERLGKALKTWVERPRRPKSAPRMGEGPIPWDIEALRRRIGDLLGSECPGAREATLGIESPHVRPNCLCVDQNRVRNSALRPDLY